MVRRLLILVPLLSFIAAQFSFGAVVPLPPRQTNKKEAPAPAEGERTPSVSILSIIPAQGEPGTTVILYGTGFTEKTTVFLANAELPARMTAPQQLSFDIPKLDPGLYALFLKREDGTTSRPYNFTILP
ncbi:MAG TPA: IPT/TIG domain-containing protein, partial [Geobacteraceae bacterium]|nr:IPT/TIG domain-containing protein [Geobacteraceae bacterium]